MPTELILTKTVSGQLAPADPQAVEYVGKLKLGQSLRAVVTKQRNPAFHRKHFALLNFAFDHWEPEGKQYKGEPVQKNFEQFRRDVTILAGYFDTTYTLKGEVRLVPKSISFASMDNDEFSALYNATINVILSRILTKYTRDDLDNVIDQLLMGFG